MIRSLTLAAALLLTPTAALAQTPDPLPTPVSLPDFRAQALNYLAQDRYLGNWGYADPEQILGRAVWCTYDASSGRYTYQGTPFAISQNPYYTADAERRQRDASWSVEGQISGRLGVGAAGATLSTSGGNEWLTRLTVRELVRLSLRTENPVTGTTLSREQIEALSFYAQGRPTTANDYWCIIDSASLWEVATEVLRKKERAGEAGFWIITASGAYKRTAQGTIPYQILTHAHSPYPIDYINRLAARLAGAQTISEARPNAPEAAAGDARSRTVGDITRQSLDEGRSLSVPVLERVNMESLQRNFGVDAQTSRRLLQVGGERIGGIQQ